MKLTNSVMAVYTVKVLAWHVRDLRFESQSLHKFFWQLA